MNGDGKLLTYVNKPLPGPLSRQKHSYDKGKHTSHLILGFPGRSVLMSITSSNKTQGSGKIQNPRFKSSKLFNLKTTVHMTQQQ